MSALDRLARHCVRTAARRWPDDLSELMAQEWCAELDALRDDPAIGPAARSRQTITFAASLALSPAVEAADAAPLTWRDRAVPPVRAVAVTAGVIMLAATLFNGIHLADHHTALPLAGRIAVNLALVTLCVAVMARLGAAVARRTPARHRPLHWTVGVGAGMFAFLMAGNRVAVMPFMGWIDILPAVATWTAVTAIGVAAAKGRLGHLIGGGLLALEAAAISGSLHAATELRIGLGSAPAWFPLSLLPGGTADFGPFAADGTASFGGLRETGPSFHAADVLLGNASAMTGPMLLCTAFVIAYASRPARLRTVATAPGRDAAPIGIAAALLSLTALNLLQPFRPSSDTLARLADNSNVFGFGFAAHAPGRILLALVIGLLAAHLSRSRTDTGHPM